MRTGVCATSAASRWQRGSLTEAIPAVVPCRARRPRVCETMRLVVPLSKRYRSESSDGLRSTSLSSSVQSEGDSEAAALESAIEDLFIGGSVGSYCGGCAYYPSRMSMDAEADRAEEAEQRGRFVAQIEGGLFDDEDLDFCGGGWLFAYDRGGWFEQ